MRPYSLPSAVAEDEFGDSDSAVGMLPDGMEYGSKEQ